MWSQNSDYLPPSTSRRMDQFDSRLTLGANSNQMASQKLQSVRNQKSWSDLSMNFPNQYQNQMPSNLTTISTQRQRSSSNSARYNASQVGFDSRNLRNIETLSSGEMWLDTPGLPNSKANLSSFSSNNKQQLNDNFNRFDSSLHNFDTTNIQQLNMNQPVADRLSYSNLDRKYSSKSDEMLNINQNPVSLYESERRWENKSNMYLDKKLNTFGNASDPNNFNNRSQMLEAKLLANNSSLCFDQNNINMNRIRVSQQSTTNRFPMSKTQAYGSKNVPDNFNKLSDFNYSPVMNASVSNFNQTMVNKFPVSQQSYNPQFSLEQSINTSQNTYVNSSQNNLKSSDDALHYSSSISLQQNKYASHTYDQQLPESLISEKLSDLSDFCPTSQNVFQQSTNMRQDNMFDQIPSSSSFPSSYSDQFFIDSLAENVKTSQENDIFSSDYKLEDTLAIGPKTSISNLFESLPKSSSQDVISYSQGHNISTAASHSFNNQTYTNTQLQSNLDKVGSTKIDIFSDDFKFENTMPSSSGPSIQVSSAQSFSQNSAYAKQNMTKSSNSSTSSHQVFTNNVFKSNQPFVNDNRHTSSSVRLYSPDILDGSPLLDSKLSDSQKLESTLGQNALQNNLSMSASYTSTQNTQSASHLPKNQLVSEFNKGIGDDIGFSLPGLDCPIQIESSHSSAFNSATSQMSNNCSFKNSSTSNNFTDTLTFSSPEFNQNLVTTKQNVMEKSYSELPLLSTSAGNRDVSLQSSNTLRNMTLEKSAAVIQSYDKFFDDVKNIDKNFKKDDFSSDVQQMDLNFNEHDISFNSSHSFIGPLYNSQPTESALTESKSVVELKVSNNVKSDYGSTKTSAKTSLLADLLNQPTISSMSSQSISHSSRVDSEIKYNIPFLSEDDKFEIPNKDSNSEITLETPFPSDVLELMKSEKSGNEEDKVLSEQVMNSNSMCKDNDIKSLDSNLNIQEKVSNEDAGITDNTLSSTEQAPGNNVSAELPPIDISQVLSDPKMLNDILHAAKSIHLPDFSQTMAFPSSTTNKNIAIVNPMQSEVAVTSYSESTEITPIKKNEIKKVKIPFKSPILKMKREVSMCHDLELEEVGDSTGIRISNSDIISPQNETLFSECKAEDQFNERKVEDQFNERKVDEKSSNNSMQSNLGQTCTFDDISSNEEPTKELDCKPKRSHSEPEISEFESKKQKMNAEKEKFEISKDEPSLEKISGDNDHSGELSEMDSEESTENINVSPLISQLVNCPVDDDDGADLVLKTISSLIEAYLKFKLRQFPEEEKIRLINSVQGENSKAFEQVLKLCNYQTLEESASSEMNCSVSKETSVSQTENSISETKSEQSPVLTLTAEPTSILSPNAVTSSPATSSNALPENSFSSASVIPPLPPAQPLGPMYSSCPVNMPMSYWMTGTPLMSIPSLPETMNMPQPPSQYQPLMPPPMMSVAGAPPLPPPPPPQFSIAKQPPLPPPTIPLPPLPPLDQPPPPPPSE